MPLIITNIVFDCANPVALASFWAAALGYALRIGADKIGTIFVLANN
jgi:hypothetical protein